jgi:hypothetical protein
MSGEFHRHVTRKDPCRAAAHLLAVRFGNVVQANPDLRFLPRERLRELRASARAQGGP